jgi:hypothetical protein
VRDHQNDRGQTFTLEAVVAAVVLLATVAFALQVVSASANTASVADAEARGQHTGLARGVLAQGAANGSLRRTLLYWDENDGEFYGAGEDGHYVGRAPPTAFGDALAAMFDARQVRYSVTLTHRTAAGDRERTPLVTAGAADDGAVRVVETVTLYDHTRLVYPNETSRTVTLADVASDPNETFYAPDARPGGHVFAVVRVEVVLWET